MLVGGLFSRQIPASLHSSLGETKAFTGSRTKVRIRFLPSHRVELRLRKLKGLEWDSSKPSRGSVVVRAEFLKLEFEAQNRPRSGALIQKSEAQRSFRERTLRQDLQRNPNQQVEAQIKPTAETLNFEIEKKYGRTISLSRGNDGNFCDNHQEALSKRSPRADTLSPDAAKKSGHTIAISRGKDAHPSRGRGRGRSRKPLGKGFDVLDELLSMQDSSSSALLEKLKMASVNKDDGMVLRDCSMSPVSSGKVLTSYPIEQKHGGMPQSLEDGDAKRRETRQPIHGFTTGNGPTSSSFASSFEKASSSFTDTKEDSLARAFASSRHQSPLQQAVLSSHRQAPPSKTEEVSEVEKPSLRGQEVLWALQMASIEKAKLKQKNRKVPDRAAKSKDVASSQEPRDWRDAKPIVVRPEWDLQMDELERRIIVLKNPMPSS